MKFAVRDDDISFFTSIPDLQSAYHGLPDIPISLSVVPNAYYQHADNFPYGEGPFPTEYGLVGDNHELVQFIRENISNKKFEVLMHGIHHKYQKSEGGWIPEMCYLSYQELKSEIPPMLEYLEKVFQCKITEFAAPSNSLGRDAFKIVDELGLNTMCLLSKHWDHPFSIAYLKYYLQRNIRKAQHKSQYTKIMSYPNHKELPITPVRPFEEMWETYREFKEYNIPLVIYTHYWALNRNKLEKQNLCEIIDAMIADGADAVTVSECFKN